MRCACVALFLAGCAFAQNQPPAGNQSPSQATGSISGTVRDASTNLPIPDVYVSVRQRDAVTDTNGHYALSEIAPGRANLFIQPDFRKNLPGVSRAVNVSPGQDLTGVDLLIRPYGTITGKVVDQNGEPVPGASISLVARQIWLGAMRYNRTRGANTDDQGHYVLEGVEPGRAFLVLVNKRDYKLDPISPSPLNPKLRRQAWVPTFYPGTSSIDGAQTLTVAPGERKEGIDFQILRSPSYCAEGVVQAPLSGGRVRFSISESQPTYGTTGDGGTYGQLPEGNLEADGKFRICNLHSGQYRLQVQTEDRGADGPAFYSSTTLLITNEDLERISAAPAPRIPVAAEVVWDGAPPNGPARALQVSVDSLTRTEYLGGPVSIPGRFSLKDAALDDYVVRVNGPMPEGAYIQDITYGSESVLRKPLRPGTASGDPTLKIILAPNGGKITTKATDKDGNPIPDTLMVAYPESAATEILLADLFVTGRADQNGSWISAPLAPGKYEVLALDLPPGAGVDRSPESLAKLLRARGKAQEIEVGAGASAQATLALTPFD